MEFAFIVFSACIFASFSSVTCNDETTAATTTPDQQTTTASNTQDQHTTTASYTQDQQTTTASNTPDQQTTTASNLITIGGQLVRQIDNCTPGDSSTCPSGYCCTKQPLVYSTGYVGVRPVYEIACKPLRRSGEFCYFRTPEHFCNCASRCHTNGFFGHCV